MCDLSSAAEPVSARPDHAPLLSIIIPVYNIEAYLMPCLRSVTGQPFRDIEIIAVDGNSADRSLELLEKFATDESRLSVIAEKRIGPGVARNSGALHARGEYIWFVDGDDELAPDCLAPICERLAAERPDVLVVNHAVRAPGRNGAEVQPGLDDRLIGAAGPYCSTLADRPWLTNLNLAAWNKIVNREFFQSCGVEFARDWPHEDVPVSCALLLDAGRISVLDHVCYYYRRMRPGSATAAGRRDRHFLVFERWLPVLENVRRAAPAGDHAGNALYRRFFERSISHCASILDAPGHVVRADRRVFFGRMSQLYRHGVPDGYRRPAGLLGVRFWLVARNLYPGYMLLATLNRLRLAADRFRREGPARRSPSPRLRQDDR
jgi:CDP-glycerol glycerophosphotransferase